jgi:hypothetical protein
MGANCCSNPKVAEKEEVMDIEKLNELSKKHVKIEQYIRVNPKHVRLLRRLQANLRKLVLRRKLGLAKPKSATKVIEIKKRFTDIPITKIIVLFINIGSRVVRN